MCCMSRSSSQSAIGMSALGHKQTSAIPSSMSALPPKADIRCRGFGVTVTDVRRGWSRYGPRKFDNNKMAQIDPHFVSGVRGWDPYQRQCPRGSPNGGPPGPESARSAEVGEKAISRLSYNDPERPRAGHRGRELWSDDLVLGNIFLAWCRSSRGGMPAAHRGQQVSNHTQMAFMRLLIGCYIQIQG